MLVYRDMNFISEKPTAVALGFFDGVHRGHSQVLKSAAEHAEKNGLTAAVFTFESMQKNRTGPSLPLITSSQEKEKIFGSFGIELLISVPFDDGIKNTSCEAFVYEILKKKLNAKKVFCGFNYTFGAKGVGNTETLAYLCENSGIQLEVLKPVTEDGTPISSTRIREMIEAGNVKGANALLGRRYGFTAKVIDGKKVGRTLGFPTVNQELPPFTVLPRRGVYLSRANVDGRNYFGVTNVGTKPTVDGSLYGAETHIFDLDKQLYGQEVRIELLEFIRDEIKFDGLECLKNQISKDVSKAISLAKEYK